MGPDADADPRSASVAAPTVLEAGQARDRRVGGPAVGAAVHESLAQAAEVMSAAGAAVLLVGAEGRSYLASPVPAIAAVERRAVDRPDGPWAAAAISRQAVSTTDSDDVRADDIRAVAAVPMFDGRRMLGVLGLYDALRRVWSEAELHHAGLIADFVARHIASDAELQRQQRLVEQLTHALDSRVVIEQAKGILAAQRGVDLDAAFRILRKRSRDRNAKIRDVAAEIVAGLTP